MNLHFVDTNPTVVEMLRAHFRKKARFTIGKFEDVRTYDAIITPGNSFGIMDGGFDLAVRNYFGQKIQTAVQREIRLKHFGEQPVGTALIVPTGRKRHPWLIHAPTMSVPQVIASTHNVYFAMLAALHAVASHNKSFRRIDGSDQIKAILCPGLGTATGKVLPASAALQIVLAWNNFLLLSEKPRTSWDDFKPPEPTKEEK